MESKQKLIEDNMELVYSVITKEYPTFIRDEDIIQSGMLGLCKAADGWDESKSKFSTYAWKAIRNEINRELSDRCKHQHVLSLDYPIKNEDGDKSTFGDLIEDKKDIGFVEAEFDERCLSQREREVYELLKNGYDTVEIRKELGVSRQWVWSIIRKIKRKLG